MRTNSPETNNTHQGTGTRVRYFDKPHAWLHFAQIYSTGWFGAFPFRAMKTEAVRVISATAGSNPDCPVYLTHQGNITRIQAALPNCQTELKPAQHQHRQQSQIQREDYWTCNPIQPTKAEMTWPSCSVLLSSTC